MQLLEPDDISLLKKYAGGDEYAFTALFERHVHLVYSAALRQARNPSHAEEVTQAVFILLARKGKSLSPKTVLSGWLYQAARLTTASLIKREIRRQRREQEVYMQSLTEPDTSLWEQISPLLDDAMGGLGEQDRNAIVLRFFENRTPQEVAAALKLDEATARKRVSRALEKLRTLFAKRGVVLTMVMIAGTISANSIQTAPAALANPATAVAIVKGATAGGSTLTLVKGALKIMGWTKMKKMKTTVVAGVGILLVVGTTVAVLESKARLDRKKDVVAYEILHQSLLARQGAPAPQWGATRIGEQVPAAAVAAVPSNISVRYFPQSMWKLAGIGTPEDTLVTYMWAKKRGDLKTMISTATPRFGQELTLLYFRNKTDAEVAATMMESAKKQIGFELLSKSMAGDDTAILEVKLNDVAPGDFSVLIFKKLGNEWRIAGVEERSGQSGEDFPRIR